MKILLCTFKTTYKVLSLHPFLSYPTISNLLSAETIPVRSAPDASILPSLPLMLFRFLPVCSGYALDRLVTVSSMHYCTSTSALSTSSSSRGLTLAMGYLILRGASRLDAFSVYPFPTWLLCHAFGKTTDTPAVGPARSSRTKASSSQISYAHAG